MFDEKMMEMELGGRTLKVSTGKIARQASGSVVIKYGKTSLLVTAVGEKEPREGTDFFPLTVDFIEKMYASGKIPGGFFKREARPSTQATLTARLTDRPLRPMFPEGFKNAVHIVITVLSYDGENTPDYLGIIGASAALCISDVPFHEPIAAVIVGYINGEYIINPTPLQLEESRIELAVAGSKDAITMVEAGAAEVTEEEMIGAIQFGHEKIKEIVAFQEKFQELAGKEKMSFEVKEINEIVKSFIDEKATEDLKKAVNTLGKEARENAVNSLEETLLKEFKEKEFENEALGTLAKEFKTYYHDLMKKLVRDAILYNHHRADGRKIDEVRPLDVEIDLLENPHGTALFTRGETQALVVTTLGTKEDEQIIDGLEEEKRKKFYLHYNFPPYSVGEAGFMRGAGRRELGHGALAERALKYVIPSVDNFPYTIRIVSEITESNGSSSMASVCGGSLSLMAAGVPIKSGVAGIAMGLIKKDEDYVVLTDIMGLEDHLGDMDFKVAGTKDGITALQMDMKIKGINEEIMRQALKQALDARMHILKKMNSVIEKSKDDLAANAPRMEKIKINKEKIAELIGPGGKTIKLIVEKTGAKIDIEDDGTVLVFASSKSELDAAVEYIKLYTIEVKEGEVYKGKVVKIAKFGAFVQIAPGKEGLLHVSEISNERIKEVEDVLKEGDEFDVKVIKVDPSNGKVSLSKKALIESK